MAISSYLSSQLNKNTNTFGEWFERTNQLSSDMGEKALTAETTSTGGSTTGNASLIGIFSANTLAVGTELRGGTVSTPASLTISSNTSFTGTQLSSNTAVFSVSSNTVVFSSDTIALTSNTSTLTSDTVEIIAEIDITGNTNATGVISATDFNSTSDIKYKKDITNLENSLETVNNLRGVNFTWKADDRKSIGFIAQEVEMIEPLLVSENKEGEKSIYYQNMIALLVESIKELKDKVDYLETKL